MSEKRIMSIKKYLKEQFVLHPSMMPSDVAKLCYQAAMGAEHLLTVSHAVILHQHPV